LISSRNLLRANCTITQISQVAAVSRRKAATGFVIKARQVCGAELYSKPAVIVYL